MPAMTRTPSSLILAVVLGSAPVLAAGSCSSTPSMVLDSDLPAVPGLESVYARNLERRDGSLVAGRIVYRGRIEDAGALLDRTIALYSSAGWTVLRKDSNRISAEAFVARGDRRCAISIRSNRIDPAMSQAQLVLGTTSPDGPSSS
jgi:hypothetical protein